MHAGNFIVVTKQEILVMSLTDVFDAASRRNNDVILLPAIRRVSGNDFVPAGQCTSTLCHTRATAASSQRKTFLHPTFGLQTAQFSVLWTTRSGLSCSIVFATDKSIVWMHWNGGSSMSGAVLNSQFLTRLLTSGEEDMERVSMLKENISSTDCELTMLMLSISVTFNVTCLTITSLITKSCQQLWPIYSCSFYKVVH